jgi:hypothetical protein
MVFPLGRSAADREASAIEKLAKAEEDEAAATREENKIKKKTGAFAGFKSGTGSIPGAIGNSWRNWNQRRYDKWEAHPLRRLLMWFIIIGLIIYVIFWSTTTTGQMFQSEVEEKVPFVKDVVNSPIIESTIGRIMSVASGDYDPTTLWSSEQVQSKYAAADNLEVLIDDAGPTRDFFYSGYTNADGDPEGQAEDIQIGGRINVIGGLEEDTDIELNVKPTWLCPNKIKSSLSQTLRDAVTFGDDDLSEEEEMKLKGCIKADWKCNILGEDDSGNNKFKVRNVYNRQFYCDNAGFMDVDKTETISDLNIKWTYEGAAVAGKQIYVFDQQTVERYDNPIEQYEISEDTIQSWYIGEEAVNIALGLPLNNEYIRAYTKYKNDAGEEIVNGIVYPIAVSIENTGSGEIHKINDIVVTWPDNEYILGPGEIFFISEPVAQFKSIPGGQIEEMRGGDISLKAYDLQKGGSKWNLVKFNKELKKDPLGPGDYVTFYINLAVDEDYLADASYQSFLIKAEIDYEYTNAQSTFVTIKPVPGR